MTKGLRVPVVLLIVASLLLVSVVVYSFEWPGEGIRNETSANAQSSTN